jgi:hypothetical protein
MFFCQNVVEPFKPNHHNPLIDVFQIAKGLA